MLNPTIRIYFLFYLYPSLLAIDKMLNRISRIIVLRDHGQWEISSLHPSLPLHPYLIAYVSSGLKRQIFSDCLTNEKSPEASFIKCVIIVEIREDKFGDAYVSLFQVRSSDVSWSDTRRTLRKDHRWESGSLLEREEKEKLFNEHIEALTKKKREHFRQLLDETSAVRVSRFSYFNLPNPC